LESHVVGLDYKKAMNVVSEPTPSAVMGPFWRIGASMYAMGESIVIEIGKGDRTLIHGCVLDSRTGKPIQGATIDTWQAAPNGKYESDDDEQADMNLRGRFKTATDGKYWYYTVRPAGYLVPHDGPAGKLLRLLDRQPRRPGHIHYIVRTSKTSRQYGSSAGLMVIQITAPGYKPLVTQLFDSSDRDLENDVAFAVKRSLIVDFAPLAYDRRAEFEVRYDFRLVSEDDESDEMRAPPSYGGLEEEYHHMPGSWRNT
jgi:catechol 1,2-dioxygenase